jgi:hypothetical protein
MSDLNTSLWVNLSGNSEEIHATSPTPKEILIEINNDGFIAEIRLSKVFPDKDFCLYKDFPFSQLVILMENYENKKVLELLKSTSHYTCTYLWLVQYFHKFLKFNSLDK